MKLPQTATILSVIAIAISCGSFYVSKLSYDLSAAKDQREIEEKMPAVDFAVREEPRSSVVAPASIASHRNVRDDRDPPLIRRETRGFKSVICPTAKAKYFR